MSVRKEMRKTFQGGEEVDGKPSALSVTSQAASPPLCHRSQASCYHHRHKVEARDEEDAEDGRKAHTAHDSDAHAAASR